MNNLSSSNNKDKQQQQQQLHQNQYHHQSAIPNPWPISNEKCTVCGGPNASQHFGAITCRACAAFFRRLVILGRKYRCKCAIKRAKKMVQHGQIGGGEGMAGELLRIEVGGEESVANLKCKGCRMHRCRRAGMDENVVRAAFTREFHRQQKRRGIIADNNSSENYARIEEGSSSYRLNETNVQLAKPIYGQYYIDKTQMDYLVRVVNAGTRVLNAFSEIGNDYIDSFGNKFNTIGEILLSAENILGRSAEFSEIPRHFNQNDMANLQAETVQYEASGRLHPRSVKCIFIGRMIALGTLKSMAIFDKLNLEDQLLLTRHISLAIATFFQCFCAYELGSQTWVSKDGVVAVNHQSDLYRRDPTLQFWMDMVFTKSVGSFTQLSLSKEEFGLILGIMCCHSAIFGLSNSARELLYNESTRLSGILFRLLQAKYGNVNGGTAVAKRFGECIHLVGQCLQNARNHALMIAYMEAFHWPKGMKMMLPKCLVSTHDL